MRKTARFMLTIAAVCSIAIAAQAVTDTKVYPGSMCIARNGASQGGVQYDAGDGHIVNSSGAYLYAICPVVRDSSVSSPADVDVSVNLGAGIDIRCYFVSCNATATSCDESDSGLKTGGGKQTFDMTVPSEWTDGYYYFECNMEAGAIIHSFKVVENA